MAINNYICTQCNHCQVCGDIKKAIDKFSDEAKSNLGVDITVNKCSNFEQVE